MKSVKSVLVVPAEPKMVQLVLDAVAGYRLHFPDCNSEAIQKALQEKPNLVIFAGGAAAWVVQTHNLIRGISKEVPIFVVTGRPQTFAAIQGKLKGVKLFDAGFPPPLRNWFMLDQLLEQIQVQLSS